MCENKIKFVLYPNGEITNIVKQVLDNVYNITPVFIVDNYKYDHGEHGYTEYYNKQEGLQGIGKIGIAHINMCKIGT